MIWGAMSRVRVQIMNQFHRKSHEYKAVKYITKESLFQGFGDKK
ncbi:transposase [Streptococcus pneumoniae]|nr:transposase [Streptococcus pneumoniae]